MAQSRDQVYHEDSSDGEGRERSRDNKAQKKSKNIETTKQERKRPTKRRQNHHQERENSDHDEESEPTLSELETTVFGIRSAFITFFSAIGIPKGFVFTKKQREVFRKQQDTRSRNHSGSNLRIRWKQTYEWKEEQEKEKIKKLFEKEKLQQASSEQREKLQDIFLQSSYIFCNETTQELYRLLMEMVKYAAGSQNIKAKVGHFVAQMTNKANGYRFFSLSFTQQPAYKPTSEFLGALKDLGEEITTLFKDYMKS